jgi:SsrA-binding protein
MSIVQNRKAFHDYFVEERYEAGLVLEAGKLAIGLARADQRCLCDRRRGAC